MKKDYRNKGFTLVGDDSCNSYNRDSSGYIGARDV